MTSGFRCDAEVEPRNELSLPCRHAGTVLRGPEAGSARTGVQNRARSWPLGCFSSRGFSVGGRGSLKGAENTLDGTDAVF